MSNKYELLTRYKKPSQEDRRNYIGIELEFFCPYTNKELQDMLIDIGLENVAHLGTDNSVHSDLRTHDYEYECRFMFPENEMHIWLPKMQEFVSACDLKYNVTCGLHVHFDMRNRNKDTEYRKLYNKLPLIKRMTPLHRIEGEYCMFPDRKSNIVAPRFLTFSSYKEERYTAVSYDSTYTIEVRCREMTDDMTELGEWINFFLCIINNKPMDRAYVARRVREVSK